MQIKKLYVREKLNTADKAVSTDSKDENQEIKHKINSKKTDRIHKHTNEENKQKIIDSYDILLTGSDITLMNCMRKEFGLEMKLLPRQFGMMDMVRKQLFYYDKRCYWEDSLTNLYNSGWVYQFNAIPPSEIGRDRTYWMKRVYEELYK